MSVIIAVCVCPEGMPILSSGSSRAVTCSLFSKTFPSPVRLSIFEDVCFCRQKRKRRCARSVYTTTCVSPCMFRCVTTLSVRFTNKRGPVGMCPSLIIGPVVTVGVVSVWWCKFVN